MHNETMFRSYLQDTLDRCFIYTIMLQRAEAFNNRMKMLFKLPIILTSSAMSIINSNFDGDTMKSINIIFNIITSVILSLSTLWAFEGKAQEFCNAKRKFIKLSTELESKQLSNDKIDPMYINSIIE